MPIRPVAAPRDPWEAFLRLHEPGTPGLLLDAPALSGPLAGWAYVATAPAWERRGGFELLDADLGPAAPDARVPWTGGLAGFVSYDAARRLERLPDLAAGDRDVPDLFVARFDRVVAYDLAAGVAFACAPDEARLREVVAALAGPSPALREGGWTPPVPEQSAKEFEARVFDAKAYVREGHVFQANLSQRLSAPFAGDPRALYARVRRTNPAPFAAYLDAGDFQILSTSPERLVGLGGVEAFARPIAGTRPRGETPAEDVDLERELRTDEKERAEHVMLVDLARNDLGRVARAGTVRVAEFARVEKYARVQHLVSDVRAELDAGRTPRDLAEATFPGGTITGAPKVRAMEVIEELEPVRRGAYTGSLFRLGRAGSGWSFDASILIRTLVVSGGRVDLQVGAGIVEDSVPHREHLECLAKARALLEAF